MENNIKGVDNTNNYKVSNEMIYDNVKVDNVYKQEKCLIQ